MYRQCHMLVRNVKTSLYNIQDTKMDSLFQSRVHMGHYKKLS